MSYIVISESSMSCPPRFVLCAPPPLARFFVHPSFYLYLACSFFFFVLFGPSPRCPVRARPALSCAREFRERSFPTLACARHLRWRVFLFLSSYFFLLFRRIESGICFFFSVGFLLLFRRMSSGIFVVYCAGCHPA